MLSLADDLKAGGAGRGDGQCGPCASTYLRLRFEEELRPDAGASPPVVQTGDQVSAVWACRGGLRLYVIEALPPAS